MNKLLKSLSCFKSMFSKLVASFILVIVVISSFHLVTNYIYIRNMETEITANAGEKFNLTVNEFEQYFSEIESKLLKDFYMEFSSYLKSPKYLDDKDKVMLDKIRKYLVTHSYLQDFVVLINNFDYVLTTEGTYNRKDYFEIFNKNGFYTEKYWMDEMKKDFTCKIYPADEFTVYTGVKKYTQRYSLPIVLKNIRNSSYILIAYIDIKNFSKDLVPPFMEDFNILNGNGELVYPEKDKANQLIIDEIAGRKNVSQFIKLSNGYIFVRRSAKNSLAYCKYYPNTAVTQQILETNRLFTLVILLSIVISIALAVYIVKKFNNPVKQIYQLIRHSAADSRKDRDIIDLKNIKEGIAGIIDRNTSYQEDINHKNSMLINYFYQARLKNIALQMDEPRRNSMESDDYVVVLIKIHYRDIYFKNVSRDISRGANILKDLIQLYLCEQFGDAITFQIEDSQIVSVINLKKGVDTVGEAIGKTAQKLIPEDEYVYFTIVYSKVYNSSSDLHVAYEKVVEILKYRKFITRTQILTENEIDKKPDVFYFPEEQQKLLSNLLANAKKDECIQLIDKIFTQNIKKEANEFCIYLLYVQVIDCCSNVLMQLFNEIPKDLPFINEYFCLGQCTSTEDYKSRYGNIISECVGYIGNNSKQSDYIVDYVKKWC